jgi:hypothetical protein
VRVLLAIAILAGVVAANACGEESPPPTLPAGSEAGQVMGHMHGLGVNPADDALVIATHTGLFRAAPDAQTAQRIGESRQDTMGFTVVGADEFLGSGHPDAREDLPPLLGLIRSADGGQTWDPVSLLGQVDFHVLRAQGQRIYGVDAQTGVLFVSADSGRTWRREQPPGALLDLAIDPDDPERIVAAGERGLIVSKDAGKSWRPISNRIVGFLAWTDALTVVDAVGSVFQSSSDLAEFRPVGRVRGEPAALASSGGELLLALHDNSVLTSSDGGRNWSTRLAPSRP